MSIIGPIWFGVFFINLFFRCILTTVSGETRTVEEAVSVIVSKAPVSVRLEVDGQNVGQTMVVNFRETNSKQVQTVYHPSILLFLRNPGNCQETIKPFTVIYFIGFLQNGPF